MGNKGSPKGFRLPVRKDWNSIWYAGKQNFGKCVGQDYEIRKFLRKKSCTTGTSLISIARKSDEILIVLNTSRPGQVIGKKGAEIDALKAELAKLTGQRVHVEVAEIRRPDLDAYLVAQGVARQIERRMPYRRILKKVIQASMDAGAKGVKVQVSGRVGGAEIARTEWYKEGQTPLHTLRANIDYASVQAKTTYGIIGIKVWINKSDKKG